MRRTRRRRRKRRRRTWRDMYMEYVLFSDSPAIMNVNRLTNFIHIKWIFVIANIINRDKSFIYYCGFPSLLDPLQRGKNRKEWTRLRVRERCIRRFRARRWAVWSSQVLGQREPWLNQLTLHISQRRTTKGLKGISSSIHHCLKLIQIDFPLLHYFGVQIIFAMNIWTVGL